MNETREMITEAVKKVGMKEILFLDSFNRGKREEIISDAVNGRSEECEEHRMEVEFWGEEESLESFARRIAEKIQKAGTREWISSLTRETAESIVNGLNAAGDCKIVLGNGRQLDAQELAVMYGLPYDEE